MQNLRTLSTTIVIIFLCTLFSTEALARARTPDFTDETTTSLSNRQAYSLAKSYLNDLQAVDPDIRIWDLMKYILSLETGDLDAIDAAMQSYLASLQPAPSNQAPIISGSPPSVVSEDESYNFSPSASDADGDSLTFSVTNLPAWAGFNTGTGSLTGIPDTGSAGLYSGITITVSDGELSASLPAFDIQVKETEQPLVAGAPALVSVDVAGSGIILSWTQQNAIPEGGYDIFIDGVDTGPEYRTTATTVTIDGLELSERHCFTVESRYTDTSEFHASNQLCSEAQAAPNEAPVISGSAPATVTVGDSYSFSPSASDADGDSLTFSVTNLPAWAGFNTGTGSLTGIPDTGSAGLYSGITITVSDGEMSASLPAFDIQVNAAEQPLVAGAPSLVSVDVSGSGITLSWTQQNAIPEGGYDIFIDGIDTGPEYRTTATTVTVGGLEISESHCFTVESRYTDTSEFYASNQLCSEAQAIPNEAPIISGSAPTTVTIGDSYNFSPSASDPDGDSLTFSVTNLPAWAGFNTDSGRLYGTPGTEDAGIYNTIVITVSDGSETASLAAFSVVVEESQQISGSTSLNWMAPSTRTDGTTLSLSEIDGYRIYMGDSETTLVPVMDINDQTVTQYTLNGLAVGTYYFSVTAYDMEGNESGFSNIVMKSVL